MYHTKSFDIMLHATYCNIVILIIKLLLYTVEVYTFDCYYRIVSTPLLSVTVAIASSMLDRSQYWKMIDIWS